MRKMRKQKTLRSQWLPTPGGWGGGEKEVGEEKKNTMRETEPRAGGRTSREYGVIVYRKSGRMRGILKSD